MREFHTRTIGEDNGEKFLAAVFAMLDEGWILTQIKTGNGFSANFRKPMEDPLVLLAKQMAHRGASHQVANP